MTRRLGSSRGAGTRSRRASSSTIRVVSAFGSLPLPDVDDALEELSHASDALALDGIVLLASIGERYLGDAAFEPVFAELNRRKTVVFIHPAIPVTSLKLKLSMPAAMVEFVLDTTRAVTNLIYSGTLERYPDIRFILAHAGGTIPFVAWRLAQGRLIPRLHEKAPQGAIAYLKRLYYDTAMSATPYALSSLRELVDPSHILFGSDWPFLPEPSIGESIRGLSEYNGFDATARSSIERSSALALFPRLRSAVESSA